jgi:CRP/FNR family transcriptional regulator, cyclic AMP receptor protein
MQPFTKTYKKGSHLFHENDHSRELYIVQSGTIKVYRIVGGHEIELALFSKGAVLGEMALIDGKQRSASARAEVDSSVIIIDGDTFLDKTKGAPPWFMSIIRMVSQKIRDANKRLDAFHEDSKGANVVIALYYQLVRYSALAADKLGNGLRADIIRNQTVQMLGITLHRVESVLDFLDAKGFIELKDDKIHPINMAGFSEYCTFLRFGLHNAFEKISQYAPNVGALAAGSIENYRDAINVQLKQVQVPGELFWPVVFSNVSDAASASALMTSLKDVSLVKTQRIEGAERKTDAEKSDNPLAGFMVYIDMENWHKCYLYHKYSKQMPPV